MGDFTAISRRRTKLLAWALAALGVGLYAGGYLAFAGTARDAESVPFTIAFATVGAFVAARHPANAVGWIFLGADAP